LKEEAHKKNLAHYKHVRISAVALLKMVMHAHTGTVGRGANPVEIMGMMLGKVVGDTMVVMDAFALPVEGESVFVTATQQCYEYMIQEKTSGEQAGRLENFVGWYHSHPGLGVFLSATDILCHRGLTEPFLAVVIDPVKTGASGTVEIGAYRTYPEHKVPSVPDPDIYVSGRDLGNYADQYYELDIEYFKSRTDTTLLNLLWNRFWVSSLASNALVTNRDYFAKCVGGVAKAMEDAEEDLLRSASGGMMGGLGGKSKGPDRLAKAAQTSTKTTTEQLHGLMTQVVKNSLFNAV
jgi:COP9 signalosome complex subunit 5